MGLILIGMCKGPAPVAESDMQNVKQLIVKDLHEKCDEYFRVIS